MTARRGRGHARREPRTPLPVESYIDFARAITKRFRLAHAWSKKEAGERCGLSSSMLTQWEKGQVNLSIETLLRLCLAVGLDLERIFVAKAEGRRQNLLEKIVLLGEKELEVVTPMIEALLHAQLAREAHESGQQQSCA